MTEILHSAMFHTLDEEAIPVVYRLLGKDVPVPPNPGKWVAMILGVVLAALVVTFLVLLATFVLRMMG